MMESIKTSCFLHEYKYTERRYLVINLLRTKHSNMIVLAAGLSAFVSAE